MKLSAYSKYYFSILALASIITTGLAQSQTRKPNIIFILSDDAGYADFSFQSNSLISTPNIDKIANQGVKFTNAYVTGAVCSPSRAGMLTGVNQVKFGQVYNFIQNVTYSIPLDSIGLPVSQKLVGEYLKPLGYATGIVGKWHEGFADRFHPNSRGFDYFWGFLWGSSPYLPGKADLVQENNKPIPAESIPYMTDAIGNQSISFIQQHADQPFFLYVSFNAPHTPMQAKPELLKKYKGKFDNEGRAINAAMTESMDDNVGRILKELEDRKLLDNTLIVFTNDNGGQTVQSFADNFPLRGRKGEIHEGGIRVPMAMMWKGKVKPGTVSEVPVSTLDLLPTFINAAGEKPSGHSVFEGTDLIKIVNKPQSSAWQKRSLYWLIGKDYGAIRTGDWKLTIQPDNTLELYNLKSDIAEENNVYDQYPAVANKLNKKFITWHSKLPPPAWVAVSRGKQTED